MLNLNPDPYITIFDQKILVGNKIFTALHKRLANSRRSLQHSLNKEFPYFVCHLGLPGSGSNLGPDSKDTARKKQIWIRSLMHFFNSSSIYLTDCSVLSVRQEYR
jgi:hypothetical protein